MPSPRRTSFAFSTAPGTLLGERPARAVIAFIFSDWGKMMVDFKLPSLAHPDRGHDVRIIDTFEPRLVPAEKLSETDTRLISWADYENISTDNLAQILA
jgi:hypothetical protein